MLMTLAPKMAHKWVPMTGKKLALKSVLGSARNLAPRSALMTAEMLSLIVEGRQVPKLEKVPKFALAWGG